VNPALRNSVLLQSFNPFGNHTHRQCVGSGKPEKEIAMKGIIAYLLGVPIVVIIRNRPIAAAFF